jgi:hypothetical protein
MINVRTGEPYSVAHVNYVRQVVVKFTEQHSRARFRAAYNAVANAPSVSPRVSRDVPRFVRGSRRRTQVRTIVRRRATVAPDSLAPGRGRFAARDLLGGPSPEAGGGTGAAEATRDAQGSVA